jgi:hypothetical protein
MKSPLTLTLLLGLAACAPTPSPTVVTEPVYTLEASVGTYRQQKQSGSSESTLGTSLLFKLRVDGKLPPSGVALQVQGPSGWNAGAVSRHFYPAGGEWMLSPEVDTAPIAGVYTIQGTLGGQVKTVSLTLSEPTSTLPLSTLLAPLKTLEGGKLQANVSWSAVEGAQGYFARILDGTLRVPASDDVYQKTLSASFTFGPPQSFHNYFALVYAANFETDSSDPVFPQQVNVSDSLLFLPLEETKGQSVGPVSLERSGFWVKR